MIKLKIIAFEIKMDREAEAAAGRELLERLKSNPADPNLISDLRAIGYPAARVLIPRMIQSGAAEAYLSGRFVPIPKTPVPLEVYLEACKRFKCRPRKEIMEMKPSSKTISISGSLLTAGQARAIAEFLKVNTKVKKLEIWSFVKPKGIEYLGEALKENNTLEYFYLHGSEHNSKTINILRKAFCVNRALKRVDLGDIKGDRQAKAIAKLLRVNDAIRIEFGCHDLGYEGIEALKNANRPGIKIVVYKVVPDGFLGVKLKGEIMRG